MEKATKIDTKWFQERIADQLMSQAELARKMEMDPPAMSLMLNGKRKMSADEAARLAGFLDVPVEDVLRRAGLKVKLDPATSVPVGAWLDAQGVIHREGLRGPKAVACPAGAPEGLQAIRAQTGGLLDGWVFFFRELNGIGLEAIGRLCVVQVLGDVERKLRFVSRGYEDGLWTLTSVNGDVHEAGRLASASPVLWVKQ